MPSATRSSLWHLVRERGLSHVQQAGRANEAELLGHGDEVPQPPQIEVHGRPAARPGVVDSTIIQAAQSAG